MFWNKVREEEEEGKMKESEKRRIEHEEDPEGKRKKKEYAGDGIEEKKDEVGTGGSSGSGLDRGLQESGGDMEQRDERKGSGEWRKG